MTEQQSLRRIALRLLRVSGLTGAIHYVADHRLPGTVSVIKTATNMVIATIKVENEPEAAAFTP